MSRPYDLPIRQPLPLRAFHVQGDTLVADASDLDGSASRWLQRLFNDAADAGIGVLSPSGRLVRFHLIRTDGDLDELSAWRFDVLPRDAGGSLHSPRHHLQRLRSTMPRINTVAKCRKSPGVCDKCRKEIAVGQGYRFFAHFRGRNHIRCLECPSWRPSETCGSATMSALLAAQENAEDAINGWDEEDADGLRSILQDAAEGFREAGQGFGEAADNIESGFNHETSTSQEFREKADEIESFADQVENTDIEDFDEGSCEEEAGAEWFDDKGLPNDDVTLMGLTEEQKAEYEAHIADAVKEAKETWAEEQRSAAHDAIGNCPS